MCKIQNGIFECDKLGNKFFARYAKITPDVFENKILKRWFSLKDGESAEDIKIK